ncbi:MAG: aminopeptidase [Oscillospiraceae bacterium]|nr:aminopeptidase [Oscillospiraceae bacterium]
MAEKNSELRDKLFYIQKNGYAIIDANERSLCENYCEDYKSFLSIAKTEREAVNEAVKIASSAGFLEYKKTKTPLKAGDRLYRNIRGKAVMFAVVGKKPLSEGAVFSVAHVDSPRLDLKQLPMFESDELCYLKTHYYGGIKKYQWTAVPLELRGTVVKKDGEALHISVGADKDDPQFVITDLLPHLGEEQMKKTMAEGITGEGLNILIGSIPQNDEGDDKVKLTVLSIINEKYGITEEDFVSADLCAVPAFEVRDIGFDRSLIGGYGHDDRVCAFSSLKAVTEIKIPEKTAVCVLTDREETGSEGVTGMQSEAFDSFIEDLCVAGGVRLRDCYENSVCISADVSNAFDPNFPDVSEKRNNAKINYGVCLMKYTGSRGKSGSSDAGAELVAEMRKIFAGNGVVWQMSELGKVDKGGGGTVAKFTANRNIATIDAGVPVLSMHSPFEIVSKFDCYMTYKAVKAVFLQG